VPELKAGSLTLRHAPAGEMGEIAGHLHPKARLSTRRRHLSCRCFAADSGRLLLPALGSFTGGLNVLDLAVRRLFPEDFDAYLLGEERVHRFPHHVLSAEPNPLSHRIAT
jgi:metallophosphoesterase superfamily enzyme